MEALMKALVFAAALAAASLPGAAGAAVFEFSTHLTGPNESPPNASPGTGDALLTWDDVAHTAHLQMTFQGLTAGTTASHIHAPTASSNTGTAGVATQVPFFTGFPLGVLSGSFDHTFNTLDVTFYNPAFVTANGGTAAGAEAALLSALMNQRAYLNIHTTAFPSGEIRGFFAVPEPQSWALMILGFGGMGLVLRRRRTATA
jgi:hypothetical protein